MRLAPPRPHGSVRGLGARTPIVTRTPNLGARAIYPRYARRAVGAAALPRAGGQGARLPAAGVSQRPVGLSRRHTADRRPLLPRGPAARADRSGGRGCRRGGRRGDALHAARGGTRAQLRVPPLRPGGLAAYLRPVLSPVPRPLPRRSVF